jgi:transcriptional regulator with XRE-family HTH domain
MHICVDGARMTGTGYAPEHVARVFGAILRTARKGAGLSQAQLAQEAGVGRAVVQLYEKGDRQPTLTKLINMADVLNVQAGQLVTMVVSRLRREATHGD